MTELCLNCGNPESSTYKPNTGSVFVCGSCVQMFLCMNKEDQNKFKAEAEGSQLEAFNLLFEPAKATMPKYTR